MNTHVAFFLSLLLALSCQLDCLANNKLPSITHEFTLNNGLTVIIQEDHRAPVATTHVWYKVGSMDEPAGKTGISHALEHMMFQGTKHTKPGEFSQLIAAVGGQDNAFTSRDYTAYHQTIAAKELELVIRLEADRMQNLILAGKEFQQEIKVVMEERRLRIDDRPGAITYEKFLATAFQHTGYGQPIAGHMRDLEALTIEDLRHWYQQWYAPNNATLVIVGDVVPETTLKLVKQHFGPLEKMSLPTTSKQTIEKQTGPQRITVNLPAKLPTLYLGFMTPTLATTKEPWEAYALLLLMNLLETTSSNMNNELVREKQLASSLSVDYEAIKRSDTLFTFIGIPNTQKNHTVEELETGILSELRKIKEHVLNKEELNRIKTQLTTNMVYDQDNIFTQAKLIGQLESVGLSWTVTNNYIDNINAVTAEQLQLVSQKYFVPNNMFIATLKPITEKPSTSH